jgi:arginase
MVATTTNGHIDCSRNGVSEHKEDLLIDGCVHNSALNASHVHMNGGHKKAPTRTVSVIGACVNEGQNWYTGVETAPDAFRGAGLVKMLHGVGVHVHDCGNVAPDYNSDPVSSDGGSPVSGRAHEYYGNGEIPRADLVGTACERLHDLAKKESDAGRFVLTIGGDHSIAIGSISGIVESKRDVGVIWIDAHADCNTPETSPSRNFHGMPLGLLLGWFKKRVPRFDWLNKYLAKPLPENCVAYIALRDVDEGEKEILRKSKIHVYSMHEVDRLGINRVVEEIIEKLTPADNPNRPFHISFDIDGMDPSVAPGTGTRSKGGLSYREGRYIFSRLAETGRVESMDLVEVNPEIDVQDSGSKEHGDDPSVNPHTSVTVKLGMELIAFALGKTLV